uniref:NADH dehydrogenase subunit 4L n=1 Tax=Janira maculosa TaxID=155701 RepID=E3SXA6_9CRUS|nr:NADH dehydrogenase subunit 4L [Janira maculosa]
MFFLNFLNMSTFFLLCFGLVFFLMKKSHFLFFLISLEMMALSVKISNGVIPESSEAFGWFPTVLNFLICEGALGLTVLIVSVRSKWQGNLSNMNLLAW